MTSASSPSQSAIRDTARASPGQLLAVHASTLRARKARRRGIVPLEHDEEPAPEHRPLPAVALEEPGGCRGEEVEALASLEAERPDLEHERDRERLRVLRAEPGEVGDLVAPEGLEARAHPGRMARRGPECTRARARCSTWNGAGSRRRAYPAKSAPSSAP